MSIAGPTETPSGPGTDFFETKPKIETPMNPAYIPNNTNPYDFSIV